MHAVLPRPAELTRRRAGPVESGRPCRGFPHRDRLGCEARSGSATSGPYSPHEIRGFVRVRPSAKGRRRRQRPTLVARARAGVALLSEPSTLTQILTVTNWAKDGDAAAVLETGRLRPLRHFLQMRIDLSIGDLPRASWPDGLELRPFSPGRDEAELFAAFREAFAEHSGNARWTRPTGGARTETHRTRLRPGPLVRRPRRAATVTGFAICREREADGREQSAGSRSSAYGRNGAGAGSARRYCCTASMSSSARTRSRSTERRRRQHHRCAPSLDEDWNGAHSGIHNLVEGALRGSSLGSLSNVRARGSA